MLKIANLLDITNQKSKNRYHDPEIIRSGNKAPPFCHRTTT